MSAPFVNPVDFLREGAGPVGEKIFPGLKVFQHALRAIGKANRADINACKVTAIMALWTVLMMALRRTASIESAFRNCLCLIPELADCKLDQVVTLNAVHNARKRLGAEPLRLMFESMAAELTQSPTFGGLVLVLLDGSRITLPDTDANAKYFGRPSNQLGDGNFPQGALLVLTTEYDRKILAMRIHPGNTDEHKAAFYFLDFLKPWHLLIMDRGIPSAELLLELHKRKIPYVARIPNDWNVEVVTSHGPGDHTVHLLRDDCKLPPLRLVEYVTANQKGEDQQVRLLTEQRDIPAGLFPSLYHHRWEVETCLGCFKDLLAPTQGDQPLIVRSKSPDLVCQELYAGAIVANLIRERGGREAEKTENLPTQYSFSNWCETTRTNVASQMTRKSPLPLATKSNRLPTRSRTNRSFPRQTRVHRHRFPMRRGRHVQHFHDPNIRLATSERTLSGKKAHPKRRKAAV